MSKITPDKFLSVYHRRKFNTVDELKRAIILHRVAEAVTSHDVSLTAASTSGVVVWNVL